MTTKTPRTEASPLRSPPKESTAIAKTARPTGDIVLAVVVGAHGIAGEVRLKVFTDDLASYKTFNAGALTLKSARHGSNGTIARFAEIADRNAAEAMRGTELAVPRALLPPLAEDEYYHADLIGLAAISTDGTPLGHIVLIENFGAGDVIEIERDGGQRFMVPMRPEAVPEWNAQRLVVDSTFVE